jgi:hypothetical protein
MPPESAIETILLTILPADGLRILNTYLPQGTVNATYDVQLDTSAVDPTWVTFAAVDGAGNPSRAALPPGITVTPDGRIQGKPVNAGTSGFLVRAQDNQNRVAVQALQLTVVGTAKGGGCSAAGGSRSCSGLLLALGLLIRQIRRRARG